jgi:hypothetical protein
MNGAIIVNQGKSRREKGHGCAHPATGVHSVARWSGNRGSRFRRLKCQRTVTETEDVRKPEGFTLRHGFDKLTTGYGAKGEGLAAIPESKLIKVEGHFLLMDVWNRSGSD